AVHQHREGELEVFDVAPDLVRTLVAVGVDAEHDDAAAPILLGQRGDARVVAERDRALERPEGENDDLAGVLRERVRPSGPVLELDTRDLLSELLGPRDAPGERRERDRGPQDIPGLHGFRPSYRCRGRSEVTR